MTLNTSKPFTPILLSL